MRVKTVAVGCVLVLCCLALVTGHRSKNYLNTVVHAQAAIDPCSDTSVLKSSAALVGSNDVVIAPVTNAAISICGFGMSGFGSTRFGYGTPTQCRLGEFTPLTGNLNSFPFIAGNHGQTILSTPVDVGLCAPGATGFVTYVQQ
jgi:hypothetical protein